MPNKFQITTLSEFIMSNKPEMLPVFVQLENCIKIIASRLRVAGLENLTGLTGTVNVYGEEVQKLDEFANALLVEKMSASQQVAVVLSEELAEPVYTPQKDAPYMFAMDPIDGSSNIDIALPVGTIFSFYNNTGTLLQKGIDQVACGYVLYSNSTAIVLTFGDGVYVFTLDSEVDCFFLTTSRLTMAESGKIYSINEGNYHKYFDQTKKYLAKVKEDGYKLRYVGSMVPDVHRTILKGGLFAYPADHKLPTGKLRLLYEVNPMSMIINQAGGMSTLEDGTDPLEMTPTTHDQTVSVVLGSNTQVKEYLSFR
jgi:fructose-1,6-bisphosphatase I